MVPRAVVWSHCFRLFKGFFVCVHPPLELLPLLGPLEQYVTPTLDAALLCSSRMVLIWVLLSRVEADNMAST